MGADLAPTGVISDDRIAHANADAIGGVTQQSVAGLSGAFAEKGAILLVVNGDGGSSLDGGCDGHKIGCWG